MEQCFKGDGVHVVLVEPGRYCRGGEKILALTRISHRIVRQGLNGFPYVGYEQGKFPNILG